MSSIPTPPSASLALGRLILRRSLGPFLAIALLTWVVLSEGPRSGMFVLAIAMVAVVTVFSLLQGVRESRDPYYCSFDDGDLVLLYFRGRTRRVLPGEIAVVSVVSDHLFSRDYSQCFLVVFQDQSRCFLPPFLLDCSTSTRLRQMAEQSNKVAC